MPYRDMRDYLATLEQHDLLRRVTREVDRGWEIACLAKWMYQALPVERRFGLRFQNVKGFDIPVVTGALGACPQSVALALQCEVDELNAKVVAALRAPLKPTVVGSGPCQEHILLGTTASLAKLPIVTWTPGKDKAPYITTIVITVHRETGVQNMGVYRTMLRDEHSVVINLGPGRQGTRNVKTWTDSGKAAPIAWVIATEPAVHLATVANLPYGKDEMDFAGGLKGEPIDLVRTKSIDLLAPANSEIIIEGEVRPGELEDEGPFGEFAGVMGAVEKRPVAHITAITHRTQPLFYGYTSQMPPSESTTIQSLMNAGVILQMMRDHIGDDAVKDVHIDQTFGGILAHAIVAMTPSGPGHGKRVGRTIADISPLKRVTVVDADVDIRDPSHVDWALNSRFNPQRDTVIIDDVNVPLQIDPSVRDARGNVTPGSKMVLDATQKFDPGPFSLPPRDLMLKALDVWNACGLPPFEIPKRAKLRIDKS
ncbi:MAG TPA: UbiD family decarboxylase [Xanthobacteraceae bacterium]|nr:UbiD family decarboxylase [Xanthobacteraceae bacterium]